jgi:hypothetical protein
MRDKVRGSNSCIVAPAMIAAFARLRTDYMDVEDVGNTSTPQPENREM